ncbi:hypothetical protein [Azospirillum thermophilum]|uniref:Uncharacterized protein n=1 Tax=Azospirillum thermophilum TaxID=2202148 RepID=A0A2S2CN48_9PROT|nr:hypothetical protein [Azospirillum thermophilum]AWK85953.1 hypothetical protein DEW08_06490 [Azospirillum thermophilum]
MRQLPIDCRILLPGPDGAVTVLIDILAGADTGVWLRAQTGHGPRRRHCGAAVWRRGRWCSVASGPGFQPGAVLRDALTRGSWVKAPPPQSAGSVLALLRSVAALIPADAPR